MIIKPPANIQFDISVDSQGATTVFISIDNALNTEYQKFNTLEEAISYINGYQASWLAHHKAYYGTK